MNDSDLKATIQETCPLLPGQEARAWKQLQERMQKPARVAWFTWRSLAVSGAAAVVLIFVAVHSTSPVVVPVSASSQAPGIFATAFYSEPAHAQVVWLNGMEPVSDGPSYMDRSGQVDDHASNSHPESL